MTAKKNGPIKPNKYVLFLSDYSVLDIEEDTPAEAIAAAVSLLMDEGYGEPLGEDDTVWLFQEKDSLQLKVSYNAELKRQQKLAELDEAETLRTNEALAEQREMEEYKRLHAKFGPLAEVKPKPKKAKPEKAVNRNRPGTKSR